MRAANRCLRGHSAEMLLTNAAGAAFRLSEGIKTMDSTMTGVDGEVGLHAV